MRGAGKGLYFGDTMSDHKAALKADLEFIGVGTIAPFEENNIPFIEDFFNNDGTNTLRLMIIAKCATRLSLQTKS